MNFCNELAARLPPGWRGPRGPATPCRRPARWSGQRTPFCFIILFLEQALFFSSFIFTETVETATPSSPGHRTCPRRLAPAPGASHLRSACAAALRPPGPASRAPWRPAVVSPEAHHRDVPGLPL